MRELLQTRYGVTDPVVIEKLMEAGRLEQYSKGGMIVESGKVQRQLPILLEGVARGYLIDADGKDITDCFVYEKGDIIFGCNQIGTPSQINIEAITAVKCMAVPLTVIQELLEKHPCFLQVYNQVLVAALDRHWQVKMLMYRCTAMERYQWFLDHYAGMKDLVSNRHIASFLGITPVTLSRLRRKMRETETQEP